MKFLVIRESYFLNIVILLISLFVSFFSFLFGIANLITPDVSDDFLVQNTIVCIVLCIIGVAFLLIAIASIQGILYKYKINKKISNE